MRRALHHHYGRASMRPIRLAPGERLGVAGVLAGAYRGKHLSKRNLLEHVVVIENGHFVKRTLCRRIPEDSLSDRSDDDLSRATCPECIRRIPAVAAP